LPREGYDTFGDILREKYEYKKCRPTIKGVKTMSWKGVHLVKWTGPLLADPLQKTLTDDEDEENE
jgi:hypothetical protein